MSKPFYVNVWRSSATDHQWTDALNWTPDLHDRDFCDRVADEVTAGPLCIKRLGVLRVTMKETNDEQR